MATMAFSLPAFSRYNWFIVEVAANSLDLPLRTVFKPLGCFNRKGNPMFSRSFELQFLGIVTAGLGLTGAKVQNIWTGEYQIVLSLLFKNSLRSIIHYTGLGKLHNSVIMHVERDFNQSDFYLLHPSILAQCPSREPIKLKQQHLDIQLSKPTD